MLNYELLSILRCPESRTKLLPASNDVLSRINAAISDGRLINCGGRILEHSIDGGLVREDGTLLYPVMDGIPILQRDDAIMLEQLGNNG